MSLAYVFPRSNAPTSTGQPLSIDAPATSVLASGSTTGTLTIIAATGGTAPYTYTAAITYDSTGNYASSISSISGSTINLAGLTSGQFLTVNVVVTDADGTTAEAQGTVHVLTAGATITAGTAPANQTLSAGTLTATIGTWGSPSGGTGPYTYAVTEPTGNEAVIGGSGLGPYTVTGLTNGRTYAFLLTITDSLGAKGYSVVTITVAYAIPEWEVLADVNLTDANWTALNSTDATASTAAPQHVLYAADGTTPRLQVWNNTTQARRLKIDPSSTGLALITTSTAASPSIKVVVLDDTGVNPLKQLDWARDLVKVEFLVEGEEPAGVGAFAHLCAFSVAQTNAANQHGYRNVESASTVRPIRRSWTTSDDSVNQATLTVGSSRKYQVQWEGYITGSRTIESYGREGTSLTDLTAIPRTGKYYFHQCASQTMATNPTLTTFNSSTTGGWGIMLYCDGSAVDNGTTTLSRVTLKRIRISRLPSGSKA